MRTVLLLITLALSTFWQPEPAFAAAPKAAPAIPDAELQQKIQEKFSKSKAGGGKFQVRVQNGVAHVSGRTDVIQHKGAATRMAKSAGAKRVVNNIVVSDAAKQKASKDMNRAKPRQASVKTAS